MRPFSSCPVSAATAGLIASAASKPASGTEREEEMLGMVQEAVLPTRAPGFIRFMGSRCRLMARTSSA